MCIRDSFYLMSRGLTEEEATGMVVSGFIEPLVKELPMEYACLLYTSDAADERSSVDLGGRRIIKKKNKPDARLERV